MYIFMIGFKSVFLYLYLESPSLLVNLKQGTWGDRILIINKPCDLNQHNASFANTYLNVLY